MKINPTIGIVGQGFVGGAVYETLSEYQRIATYDIHKDKCNTDTLELLIDESDIIFVCLPTPMTTTGRCYTGIVEGVLDTINSYASPGKVIITKSTVPPGTHRRWNESYSNLSIVFNPEFLTEANAVQDFRTQRQIILGSDTTEAQLLAKKAFEFAFPANKVEYISCSYEEAEAIKYFRNTFLSVKISFCNEFYIMCKQMGIDYDKVSTVAHLDNRLGTSHYKVPGPDGDMGFGGHCFPKDINALINKCQELNIDSDMLMATWKVNEKYRQNRDWENMPGRAIIKEKT
tara:strand:+ start:61 stop:924 length:864 start_codon:yes stop_codon:yes gene_type:complete